MNGSDERLLRGSGALSGNFSMGQAAIRKKWRRHKPHSPMVYLTKSRTRGRCERLVHCRITPRLLLCRCKGGPVNGGIKARYRLALQLKVHSGDVYRGRGSEGGGGGGGLSQIKTSDSRQACQPQGMTLQS